MARSADVGIKFKGDPSDYKRAAEEARRATAQLRKDAEYHSREMERKFKDVSIGLAKIGAAALVAQKAFQLYAAAMNTTEGSADRLEEQISTLKGAVQGAMQTIFSGDWGMLIDNIKNTAQATREYAVAMDKLTEAQARNKISKGDLEFIIQSNRVMAAETTDPVAKQGYIQAAIDAQKQLTAINKSEIQQRINAQLDYYKTIMGQDEKYWKLLTDNLVHIAKNYDSYITQREGNDAIITDLTYKQTATIKGLTDAEKEELRVRTLSNALIRDYLTIQGELSKKGQFEQLLSDLAALREESAKGEQELVRLSTQLTKVSNQIYSKGHGTESGIGGNFAPAGISLGQTDDLNELAKRAEIASGIAIDMQTAASSLEGIFTNLFSAGMEGWDEFGEAAVSAIKKITAEILAKAAVWMILSLLPGGAGLGSLSNYVLGGFGIKTGGGMGGGPIGGNFNSKIYGSDILVASSRYSNTLNNAT
jgi:hypothetical protein